MRLRSSVHLAFLLLFLSASPLAAQADLSVRITGKQAKDLYLYLTGSAVVAEGAAGHLYRSGKVLGCRYADADMSDAGGKAIPQEDPRRYACGIKVDHDGLVSVNPNY